MGTKQHIVLFEHVTGFSLFRIKEFDEITRNFSAHVNAFLKPLAFVHFGTVSEAVENVQAIAEGVVTPLLWQFLCHNISPKDTILGVSDKSIGQAIAACDFGFECVWHSVIREILRVIRQNFSRLTRSLITQPGSASSLALGGAKVLATNSAEEIAPGRVAESRARLIVGLACARLQLNLNQHLADTAVIKALTLIDELDGNLARSTTRLRTSYASHFPEICRPGLKDCPHPSDIELIRLIAHYPVRSVLASSKQSDLAACFSDTDTQKRIREAAQNSIGCELNEVDAENLRSFAQTLLKMIEMREKYAVMLSRRVESLAPNLYSLLNSALPQDSSSSLCSTSLRISDNVSPSLVAARLILNAGSLTRLASMTASRVLSLGASKALFRKSGAVAATSTGLLNSICQNSISLTNVPMSVADDEPIPMTAARMKALSGNRLQPDIVRRRAARLLAAKSSLACKADCFRFHNPVENDYDDAEQPSTSIEDPRLASGAFGVHLAADVQRQLKIWAETNGIHLNRTRKQEEAQRQRRKRYRKAKRKAWLARKLSRAATGCEATDAAIRPELGTKVDAVGVDDVDMDATLASPSHAPSAAADSASQDTDSPFEPSIGRQSLRGKQRQLVSAMS